MVEEHGKDKYGLTWGDWASQEVSLSHMVGL